MTIAPMRFHSAVVKPDRTVSRAVAARLPAWLAACCAGDESRRRSRFFPSTYWITPSAIPTPAAGEADVPVDALRQIAGDERPDERAEVDPHVEDREAGVAARVARLVERSDERADVRLEQPGAEHDQREAGVEEGQRLEGEREVAERR